MINIVCNNNYVLRPKDDRNAPIIRKHVQFLFAPETLTRNIRKPKGDSSDPDSEQEVEE